MLIRCFVCCNTRYAGANGLAPAARREQLVLCASGHWVPTGPGKFEQELGEGGDGWNWEATGVRRWADWDWEGAVLAAVVDTEIQDPSSGPAWA